MVLKNNIKIYLITFLISFSFISKAIGQTQYFNSFDETKIAYLDEGKGNPVLLIHGFINSKNSWAKTALKKELLGANFRVISIDLRGNGESGKPQEDLGYIDDAEIKDIKLLLDNLKIKKCFAVGYSRGSIVLAKLLTSENRIKKAVLGGMGIDFTNPNWDRKLLFAAAFDGKTTEETQGAVTYAKSIGADLRSLHLQQKHQPITSIAELQLIKTKVLVIAGDQDLDNGDPKQLQKALPNAILRIIKGDHNGTYKTKPFSSEVSKFLLH